MISFQPKITKERVECYLYSEKKKANKKWFQLSSNVEHAKQKIQSSWKNIFKELKENMVSMSKQTGNNNPELQTIKMI